MSVFGYRSAGKMGLKQSLVRLANAGLRPLGAQLVKWEDFAQLSVLKREFENDENATFKIGTATFTSFAHAYNCGWPNLAWATERTIELALADRWLELSPSEELIEVGAVSPYYWPRRVTDIIDPFDPHPQVTIRNSMFESSLRGRSVLSISTIEHIGTGDYNLPKATESPINAIQKIYTESSRFLVTFPNEYNPPLDAFVFSREGFPSDVDIRLLVRNSSGIGWVEKPAISDNARPYSRVGAGSVLILHRGTPLFDE